MHTITINAAASRWQDREVRVTVADQKAIRIDNTDCLSEYLVIFMDISRALFNSHSADHGLFYLSSAPNSGSQTLAIASFVFHGSDLAKLVHTFNSFSFSAAGQAPLVIGPILPGDKSCEIGYPPAFNFCLTAEDGFEVESISPLALLSEGKQPRVIGLEGTNVI